MATAQGGGGNGRPGAPGERYGPERRGRAASRRTAGRAAALSAALLLAAMPLIALADDRPYTTIDPMTEAADDIQGLYKLIFYLTIVVFVGVQALILYTALRFRQKRRLANRPEQIHGNSRLEIGWTIAPAVVLLAIFVFTVPVMYSEADEANDEEGALVVEVYGKQWWWEVHYPGLGPNGSDLITANEVRLPAGQKVVFHLYTNNVIHSFWVPQLAGKMDVMPGYRNKLAFTPEIPGDYYGECAEFCGTSHAWMRFKVIVEPPEQFNGWVAAWGSGSGGDLAMAPPAFGQCIACHKINGTENANLPLAVGYEGAYTAGPNLTLFGCRETLAGGLLINNEENLRAWLHDPASVKEGNLMATVIKAGALNDQQLDELVTYLLSLRLPDGTCPPEQGTPGSSATPAAAAVDPAAGDVVASSE
jgi:cytochrome c oxidase subunit II